MIYKWHKENYRKYVSNSFVTIGQNDKDNSAIYKTFENLFNFYESYVSLIFFFSKFGFYSKNVRVIYNKVLFRNNGEQRQKIISKRI
jgi:hypothetical protein